MNKTVRTTLVIEVVKDFDKNYDGANDENTLQYLVAQDLENKGYDVRKCEILNSKRGLILEQLKRVDEAELNFQMETAKLNELIRYKNE